ncbi:phosphohistidine phosphatase [Olsenella profusa DSM 13989]|uniref:SixA phosphatase family protein n=1 Tax=Olsenella profusa TaxID=138595 RepID=UPI0027890DFB|nr:histidine phosphatase family protein [Olsenella profusa]MDP9860649.1 phosphohistidine phosphatase [Olsenella profusa DSM 13989]
MQFDVRGSSMVTTVVLVRHGDAEPRNVHGDKERQLTAVGLRALERAYPQALASLHGVKGLALWASPAVRALQTAKVVAHALGIDPEDIDPHDSLYEQDEERFLAELGAAHEPTVVAVGHVPFMERLACTLTGESVAFHKGAIRAIRLGERPGEGELLWGAEA